MVQVPCRHVLLHYSVAETPFPPSRTALPIRTVMHLDPTFLVDQTLSSGKMAHVNNDVVDVVDDEGNTGLCWQCYCALQDRLAEPDDNLEVIRSKLVVFVAAVLCGACGTLWSLCYWVFGVKLAALFPALLVLVCFFSTVYLLTTRRLPLARSALCHGLAFTALGIHWSFGGSGSGSAVASWAILGPQLLRTTGAGLRECLWQLVLLIVVLVGFSFAEVFVGAELLTPQRATLPRGWDIGFSCMNILCPGIVSFLAILMVLGQLEVQKTLLAKAMDKQMKLTHKVWWCGVVWCGVVWCGVVWCGVPKALLPKGKRPGCLPTGTGKRAGLCVLCARCA